jgi:hypothetical protein
MFRYVGQAGSGPLMSNVRRHKMPQSTTDREYRQWVPPVETTLSDLHGCFDDLFAAREFAGRLAAEFDKEAPDSMLLDALATALFVWYCRSFTTGARTRLRLEDHPLLTSEERVLHARLREIRDWHIAHPVNLQEIQALYVAFDPDPTATTGVVGISATSSTDLGITSYEAEATVVLCQQWLDWLLPLINQEYTRLRPLADKLTRPELFALPSSEVEPSLLLRARRPQRKRK